MKTAVKSGAARSGLVYLIGCLSAPVIVLVVFGSVFLLDSVVRQSPVGGEWALPVVYAALSVLCFGGLAGLIAVTVIRRKRFLDRVFVPFGLTGNAHNLLYRRYQGTLRGRQVEIYFAKGPVLEILIATNLRTRLGITLDYPDTTAVAELAGHPPLRPNSPNLRGLLLWADDKVWAGNLILVPQTEVLLRRLLLEEDNFLRRDLLLRPTILQLHYSGNPNLFKIGLSEALVRQWLSDLFEFLALAETEIPVPAVPIEMSQAEITGLRWKRKDLTRPMLVVLLAFTLVLILFPLVVMLLAG